MRTAAMSYLAIEMQVEGLLRAELTEGAMSKELSTAFLQPELEKVVNLADPMPTMAMHTRRGGLGSSRASGRHPLRAIAHRSVPRRVTRCTARCARRLRKPLLTRSCSTPARCTARALRATGRAG